jgi:tetratricopeptide (TPR) repeat protein
MRLSACLITRNEATELPRCLRSLRPVCDEIIVVDTGSTDATVEIARAAGCRLCCTTWRDDFAAARNTGLAMARGDWILVVDADEELDDASRQELREAIEDPAAEAYWVRIQSFLGDSPDDTNTVENFYPRLFRRRREYRFEGAVHEQILPSLGRAGADVLASEITLLHYGYLSYVVQRKGKARRNTQLIEEALRRNPLDAYQWFNLGTEHLRLRRPQDAERAFRQALGLLRGASPRYLSVLMRNLILAMRDQRRYTDALEVTREAQQQFPDYTDLAYFEGLVAADLHDWDTVEAAMRRAIALGPAPSDRYLTIPGAATTLARTWLAIADCERGRDPREALRRAAETLPEEAWSLYHLATLATRLEGQDAALSLLAPVARTGESARSRVARALARAGAYRAALTASEGLPDSATLHIFRGECLFRLGRDAEARSEWCAVPEGDPVRLPALLDAAIAAAACGHTDKLAEVLRLLEATPHAGAEALLTAVRAVAAILSGAGPVEVPDEAREVVCAVVRNAARLALVRGHIEIAQRLGLLLRTCGLTDAEHACLMGKLAYLVGQEAVARRYLAVAFGLGGCDVEGLAIAAEIHFRSGAYHDAVVCYRPVIADPQPHVLSIYLLALSAALRDGAHEDAGTFLEAALRVYPQATVLHAAKRQLAALAARAARGASEART